MSTDNIQGSANDFGNNNSGTIAHAHIVNVNIVNIAIQSNESHGTDTIEEQYKELGAVVVEKINGRLTEGVRSTSSLPHPSQVQTTQESLYSIESRSLGAIGEQHKELGALVVEKINGRLAEGSTSSSPHPPQVQATQESLYQYRSVKATYEAPAKWSPELFDKPERIHRWAWVKPRHNIVIFGETGAGKSSVVNMLVGREVAETSRRGSCTKTSKPYDFKIKDCHFRIFDTAGFNEGDQDRDPSSTALTQLYDLLIGLDGVSLLVYCMRTRMKESSVANWKLFHQVVCKEKVPITAVITGLDESEEEMDEWWPRYDKVFRDYGLDPLNFSCVTAIKGKWGVYERLYNQSKTELKNMIFECRMETPWHAKKDSWWGRGGEGGLEELTMGDLVDECGFDPREARKILEAMKSGRKRSSNFFF